MAIDLRYLLVYTNSLCLSRSRTSQLSEQEVEKDVGRVDEGFLSADPSLSDPALDVGATTAQQRFGCSRSALLIRQRAADLLYLFWSQRPRCKIAEQLLKSSLYPPLPEGIQVTEPSSWDGQFSQASNLPTTSFRHFWFPPRHRFYLKSWLRNIFAPRARPCVQRSQAAEEMKLMTVRDAALKQRARGGKAGVAERC